MFTELYVEALLVNRRLADLIHALWMREMMDDKAAAIVWFAISQQDEFEEFVPTLESQDDFGH